MSFDSLCRRSFSRILDITGKRLIGLYDVTSVGFFPGLRIITTFACFFGLGQCSSLIIALSKWRIALRPSGGSSCIMSVVTRSGPGALCGWRRLITPLSSPMVNARGFSVC